MRTLQSQLQDIADWIAGIEIDPMPSHLDFQEGALRTGWLAVRNQAWDNDAYGYRMRCESDLKLAMTGYRNGMQLYERILRVITSDVERPFRSLAEIASELQPVTWLWKPWLPLGMLTLLAAQQGTGKSMLALDLARRIIVDEPWPDGTSQTRPNANVIYVDGERIPSVHNDRAMAWHMPCERLYMLLADEEDGLLALESEKYQERLTQMVYRLEPALVIVDSLGAVLSRGENGVEDVRALLGYLAGLAQAYGCAILILHHLRKTNGQMALFDSIDMNEVRGSGHITAMSRVAWGLKTVQTGQKPDPNGPRKLAVIKSNLSRHPEPLGVQLEPIPGNEENARVVYAEDAPESYKEPTAGDEAETWLLGYLEDAGRPVKPADVVKAGAEEGYNRMMIYRAREALSDQILNTGGRKNPKNRWALASTISVQPEGDALDE